MEELRPSNHATDDLDGPEKNVEPSNATRSPIFPDGYDSLGVIGFALYLTWFFLVLVGTAFGQGTENRGHAVDSAFLFLFGEAIGAVIVWFVSGHIANKRGIVLCVIAVAILTLPSGISLLLSGNSAMVMSIVWPAAGFGAVILLSLWGFFLSRLNHAAATLYPAISVFIMACLLAFICFLIKDDAIALMMTVLPLLSVAIFFAWASHLWQLNQFTFPKKSRPPDWRSLSHSAAAMVANSFLLGFVIYAVSAAEPSLSVEVVFIAIALAACFKMYDARNKRCFEVSLIIKVIAPTATIGLLLLPFLDMQYRFILLAGIMLIAMIDEIICWSAVSEYMHVHELLPFANMTYGRIGDTIGLFLGYLCGTMIFGITMLDTIPFSLVIAISVILFAISQAFFFKDNYTPFSEHRSMNEDFENNATPPSPKSAGHWKERRMRFAEHYQLTPRQQEVLLLLAKGYSTGAIEKNLVVSNYTVKAHVYGIYKKTDVHTRQELIELMERFDYGNE